MTPLESFLRARDLLINHRDDYKTAYREFRWPTAGKFNWALDYFDAIARGNSAQALWIVDEGDAEEQLSFNELSERSNSVANYLVRLGVKRGDRILFMLNNVVPLWETMLAAIKVGAVVIPATTLLTRSDMADRLERGNVKHLILGASEASKFSELGDGCTRISVGGKVPRWQPFELAYSAPRTFIPAESTKSSDPLLLYFTSGTTSKPKLVEHTHFSYPVGHLSTMYWIGLKPGDIHYNISSPGWAKHAWSCFFAPWNAGATVFAYNCARFNAKGTLNMVSRYAVTTLCAPPTVWRMLIQEDLASYPVRLREVIGAGEHLNPEVIEKVRQAWGLTIRDGFGQTETTAQVGNTPGQAVKAGSMGRPLPGYRVVLLNPEGKETEEGELSISLGERPVGLMKGYQDDPERTAEVMRGGYYRTGDVASRDGDGYYTYIGRADDVFKVSDYRVSPFELESVLIEHEAIVEAAVVPSPDPIRLAVPKAFVALRAGCDPSPEVAQDILRFARDRLAPFKRIRRIEFTELPKTISGKIRRVELRKLESERGKDGPRRPNEFWEEDFDNK